jgi:hypothetical protein
MAGSPPIACTLDAADRPQRERDIRTLGSAALLAIDRRRQSAFLRFRRDPGIRARVEAIAAAEADCCAFLDFEVAAGSEVVTLRIDAPHGGEPMMDELASLFARDTEVRA